MARLRKPKRSAYHSAQTATESFTGKNIRNDGRNMPIEDDILDLIAQLPDQLNEAGVTTELKFLTLGGVLWACREEILRLRKEVAGLKSGKA